MSNEAPSDAELAALPVKEGFRLRGESISRLETLVDAAFAFALSMLVISIGALPKDVDELFTMLTRVPSFGACFLLLFLFWSGHNRWSRRFGIDDATSTVLSFLLVFATLIYVFPLRAVISSGIALVTGGWAKADIEIHTINELEGCFIVYGVGWTALSLLLHAANRHALRRADALGLDELERLKTRRESGSYAVFAAFGIASIVIALFARNRAESFLTPLPGFVYMGIGVAQHYHHARCNRRERRLVESGAVVRRGRTLTVAELR